MKEIHAVLCFICSAPCAETAECPVAERLLRKRCCVEGILEPNVKHQGFEQFIIGEIGQFLDQQRTDLDINRRVWA